MSKTFRSILAEQDTEYTYLVKSIYNIHEPDVMDQVRLALLPYDLRDIEKDYYKPIDKDNKDFPGVPNSPCYALKAVLGLQPQEDDDAVQKVALFTRINDEHIVVHERGKKPDSEDNSDSDEKDGNYKALTGTAKDFSSSLDHEHKDAQSEVGDKRITNLVKELEKERKEREKQSKEVKPKLKESFCTSHIALNQIENKWKRGFYVVERVNDELQITGPWEKQPLNYKFLPELLTEGVTINSEDGYKVIAEDRNFRFINAPMSRRKSRILEVKFSVDVEDQDTGKSYNVIVDAVNDAAARTRATRTVARKYKLEDHRLLASNPQQSK